MQLNENSLIETMFDVMPFAVYVVDVKTLAIVHMNRVMVRLRGGNHSGRTCHKALYEIDSRCIHCRMDEILDEQYRPNGLSITYEHFDEMDDCWYQIQEKAITWPDGRVVKCTIAVDISELKEMQNHLAEAHAQLALKNRELEQATLHKNEFLANLSHEIRTPLNAVIGLSDLALKTELTLKQQDYLNKIHTSSEYLLRILNDILDFSKIEAGRIDLEHLPFELPQMIDEILSIFYHASSRKGVELLLSFDDNVPWFLVGDSFRLGQILSNLIGNALKFTDSGHIVTNVNLVSKTDQHATIRFSVSDTGIGISEEALPNLFRSFTQADPSTTRKYGGTGLGLAICKNMVELMNGTIWVESVKGKGSTFTFEIDLELQKKEFSRKPLEPSEIDGLRVVVADDNPVSMGLMEKMLTTFGCIVTPVDSGESALKIMRHQAKNSLPFDLLITDWHMKQIDGIELATIIKKDHDLRDVHIILISALDKDGLLREESNGVGVDAFISKPVNQNILLQAMMNIFCARETKTTEFQQMRTVPPVEKEKLQLKQILLVDDNSINRQVARELLEHVGVVVHTASSGEEAVKLSETEPLDAILMDVKMPGMDGYEATRKIRKRLQKIPIIAMTALSGMGESQKAIASGMDDFIAKPIDPTLLYHTLIKWISESKDGSVGGGIRNNSSTDAGSGCSSHSDGNPDIHTDQVMKYFETVTALEMGSPASSPCGLENAKEDLLDTGAGIRRLAGNVALYKELLAQYINDAVPKSDQLKQAMKQKNFKQAGKIAHYIKGVSGNIGLGRVFNRSAQLEKFLMNHCHEAVNGHSLCHDLKNSSHDIETNGNLLYSESDSEAWELYAQFITEITHGVEAIELWLKNGEDNNGTAITQSLHENVRSSESSSDTDVAFFSASKEDVGAKLRTLYLLLKESNTKALEQIDIVMAADEVASLQDARQMAQKIASLDFDAAFELLLRVAAQLAISIQVKPKR